jgi:hypothetical protein
MKVGPGNRLNRAKPRISVIIPIAPGASAHGAKASLKALFRRDRGFDLEIIEIGGRQPARQRNLAAQRSGGEFLYFLDHDSLVSSGAIQDLLGAFSDDRVGAAGGPNPGARLESAFARASELVLGSKLGSLTVWRRYVASGSEMQRVGEESLILCNLMVRRELFLDLGGFDPRLYPNEENEFLNRLRGTGRKAMYVPSATVRKPRAGRTWQFIRENFRYARGRMEQVWINPSPHDAPYLLGLAAFALLPGAVVGFSAGYIALVLGAYIGAAILESFRLAFGAGRRQAGLGTIELGMLTAGLMLLRHSTYGTGLLFGALTGWRKRRVTLGNDSFSIRSMRFSHYRPVMVRRSMEYIGAPMVCRAPVKTGS